MRCCVLVPDRESSAPASSSQTGAWARLDALVSFELVPQTAVCPSSPSRSAPLRPESRGFILNSYSHGSSLVTLRTFWASLCLSKSTNPNPLEFPFSSVITRALTIRPTERCQRSEPKSSQTKHLQNTQNTHQIYWTSHRESCHPALIQSSWCKRWWILWLSPSFQPCALCGTWSARQTFRMRRLRFNCVNIRIIL